MKENGFSFVSLQQQRPDLPRLLVSTATVELFSSRHALYVSVCDCMFVINSVSLLGCDGVGSCNKKLSKSIPFISLEMKVMP